MIDGNEFEIEEEEEEEQENDDVYEILFSVLDDYFGDMYAQYVNSLASPSDADFESDVVPYTGEDEIQALEDTDALAVYDSSAVSNVLSYHVRINGTAYLLYLSPDDIDRIYIDSQNRMWNVGNSQITGRLFQGTFSPTATTGNIMYLSPCLGNNFSNNRNYGSPNFYRNYYWTSNNTLTYGTTYCTIVVEDTTFPLVNSMIPSLVIIFLVGVIFICLLRKSHN